MRENVNSDICTRRKSQRVQRGMGTQAAVSIKYIASLILQRRMSNKWTRRGSVKDF